MWGTLCFPITLGVLVLFVSLGIPNLKIKFLILVSDIRHCWWWSKTLNLKAALLLQWYLGRIRLLPRDWCCHLAPSTRNTETEPGDSNVRQKRRNTGEKTIMLSMVSCKKATKHAHHLSCFPSPWGPCFQWNLHSLGHSELLEYYYEQKERERRMRRKRKKPKPTVSLLT